MQVILLTFGSVDEMIEQLPRLMKQLSGTYSAVVPVAGALHTNQAMPVSPKPPASVPSNQQMSLAEIARATIAGIKEIESSKSKGMESRD